jgi:uncharacterized membrane protein YgdD (TMEM256/DUF423 family)
MSMLIVIAGLMGAAGIWLSAAGAHSLPQAKLDVAGTMLLVHAAAVLGAAAVTAQGLTVRPLALAACGGLALGAALFAGDLGMRAYMGMRVFPGAAPAGGFVLLVSWLALGLAGFLALTR